MTKLTAGSGTVLCSDDEILWKEICAIPEGKGFDRVEFRPVKGRYFKVQLDRPVSGTLTLDFDGRPVPLAVDLAAGEDRLVSLDPFRLDRPEPWWPNGYGDPHLYDVSLAFDADGKVSDTQHFKVGVRQMTVLYDTAAPSRDGCIDRLTLRLANTGDTPAMMLRVKVTDTATGDLVVPVLYSDNYFFLMPGESREVAIRLQKEDISGRPVVSVSGFNVDEWEFSKK